MIPNPPKPPTLELGEIVSRDVLDHSAAAFTSLPSPVAMVQPSR